MDSPDGPRRLPAVKKAVLLSEVEGSLGRRTLFFSSVADGYMSMIHMVSKKVKGPHIAVHVSRPIIQYPRNAITVVQDGVEKRVVYSMKDVKSWEFFQLGEVLYFENPSHYLKHRKQDRLTVEVIEEYIKNIGYGSLDANFWVSDEPAHLLCDRGFLLVSEPAR